MDRERCEGRNCALPELLHKRETTDRPGKNVLALHIQPEAKAPTALKRSVSDEGCAAYHPKEGSVTATSQPATKRPSPANGAAATCGQPGCATTWSARRAQSPNGPRNARIPADPVTIQCPAQCFSHTDSRFQLPETMLVIWNQPDRPDPHASTPQPERQCVPISGSATWFDLESRLSG